MNKKEKYLKRENGASKRKKCDEQINLIISNKNKSDKTIKEFSYKTRKLEMEVTELYNLLKTMKRDLTLKNKFSINLSYSSFFLSAVALALSLVACL